MKVVPQSFTHLPESNDHIMQIGTRARICYQSEPKDNEKGFVQGLITRGHNSCLEMAVIHIILKNLTREESDALLDSNYIIVDRTDLGIYCTGSIRAWREFIAKHARLGWKSPVVKLAYYLKDFLSSYSNPLFWADLCPEPIEIDKAYFARRKSSSHFYPLNMPVDLRPRHEHTAMRIITNRAVTHELVRHRPVAYLQESQRYCRYSEDKFGNEVTFIDPSAFYKRYSWEYRIWKHAMEYLEETYLALLENSTPQAARTVLPNSCKTEIIVYCSLKQWEHILAMRHHPVAEPSMQELMEPMFCWFNHVFPQYFPNQESLKRSVG